MKRVAVRGLLFLLAIALALLLIWLLGPFMYDFSSDYLRGADR